CAVHDIDETSDGRMFIVMPYYGGETLQVKVERGALEFDEAIHIASQVASGLAKAHEKGIVHRDIKSANILIANDGHVRILDFGLAKLAKQTRLTKTGTTVGTVMYMSPEQAKGDEVDARSDIFSLGVVLYELLTGELPFQGDHEAAVIYSIMNKEPEPLAKYRSDIPEGLHRIVEKAMAKKPDERYRSAADLEVELKQFQVGLGPVATGSNKNLLKYLLPASVFLAVILFLIFKPFKFEVSPDQKAAAAENSLAVMYFDNLVDRDDPQRLGEIVTNLLITDLSESQYMRVVSTQRLYDILKFLGKEGAQVIDKTTATRVAARAEAKWMLLGSVLQEEPSFVVTAQLIDVESGDVVAAQRVTSQPGEKIFALIDKLTSEIKDDLHLPAAAKKENDPWVAEVTTGSTEAYRYYLEGNRIRWEGGAPYASIAAGSYRKALEYDSTFAMAYLALTSLAMPGTGNEKRELIAKALRFSDRIGKKEKRYIKSRSHYLSGDISTAIQELEKLIDEFPDEKRAYVDLGFIYQVHSNAFQKLRVPSAGMRKAISYYQKTIELDPLHYWAYNQLAYTYNGIGEADSSIWAINRCLDLAPDETAGGFHDTHADLYRKAGKFDRAIESYEEALTRAPENYESLMKLGQMHLYKREYAKARASFQKLLAMGSADNRSMGRYHLALIPLHQGKMEEALHVLDQGMSGDEMEGYEGDAYLWKLFSKSSIYAEKAEGERAVAEFEKLLAIYQEANPENPARWRDDYIYLLAKKKDFVTAEKVLGALKNSIVDQTNARQTNVYWFAKGWIDLERGNIDAAVTDFEESAKWGRWFWVRYPLAMAYLKAGRLAEAVGEFEGALKAFSPRSANYPTWVVKARFYLGTAYENSGWNNKAIEQYEEFLDIWKDADPGIEEVEDAKRRLAALKGENRM
ncbi:MAG: FlgO family outer membrane protein, partial [Candidatus Krumholzibacteria bacterium]